MSGRRLNSISGFTLVELLVALMVSSIIFAAILSLTYAAGTANDWSEDISYTQSQIRQTVLRLSELIRNSMLIILCSPGDDLAVWRADDDLDGKIDPAELVYIEAGSERGHIYLLEFPQAAAGQVGLSDIADGVAKSMLLSLYEERYTQLLPSCSDVQFYPETITAQDRFVNILFDVDVDGQVQHYQVNATVRAWAGHLLNGTDLVSGDDD